jgi:hypothetical protein
MQRLRDTVTRKRSDRAERECGGKMRVGGPPSLHKCPRCGTEIAGRKLYEAHLHMCPSPPPQPIGPEDLVPWTPDDAA